MQSYSSITHKPVNGYSKVPSTNNSTPGVNSSANSNIRTTPSMDIRRNSETPAFNSMHPAVIKSITEIHSRIKSRIRFSDLCLFHICFSNNQHKNLLFLILFGVIES